MKTGWVVGAPILFLFMIIESTQSVLSIIVWRIFEV